MNRIKLYFSIKRFYTIFGEVLGSNFITSLSDMTNDNLYDVMFDINEAIGYDDPTDPMVQWLNELYEQIVTFREKPKHKATVLLCTLLILTTLLVGCAKPQEVEEPKQHTRYTAFGRYHTNGSVITDDGNEWDYTTDIISDKTPYDNMPVWIGFDDNGTPNNITDDIILGLVFDIYTAIYDDLETSLSDKFELERDGNNIHIKEMR